MTHDEELYAAEHEFELATTAVRKALPGKNGPGTEAVYGQAYQRLVRLGARPQIRGKYRG